MEKIQQQTGNFLRNSNNDRLQSSNKAYTRIKRKIRRSRIKAAVGLYSEMLLILFVILLLILCIYFFFIFDTGLQP